MSTSKNELNGLLSLLFNHWAVFAIHLLALAPQSYVFYRIFSQYLAFNFVRASFYISFGINCLSFLGLLIMLLYQAREGSGDEIKQALSIATGSGGTKDVAHIVATIFGVALTGSAIVYNLLALVLLFPYVIFSSKSNDWDSNCFVLIALFLAYDVGFMLFKVFPSLFKGVGEELSSKSSTFETGNPYSQQQGFAPPSLLPAGSKPIRGPLDVPDLESFTQAGRGFATAARAEENCAPAQPQTIINFGGTAAPATKPCQPTYLA
jgi:hypothetical protein